MWLHVYIGQIWRTAAQVLNPNRTVNLNWQTAAGQPGLWLTESSNSPEPVSQVRSHSVDPHGLSQVHIPHSCTLCDALILLVFASEGEISLRFFNSRTLLKIDPTEHSGCARKRKDVWVKNNTSTIPSQPNVQQRKDLLRDDKFTSLILLHFCSSAHGSGLTPCHKAGSISFWTLRATPALPYHR